MQTLEKSMETKNAFAQTVSTADLQIDILLNREWLLTNGNGGYASSTIIGCNTRNYHGLLIGSLTPPVNRIMALANCLETISTEDGPKIELSTFEFDKTFIPEGYKYLKSFSRDTGVHFHYETELLKLNKSIYLSQSQDIVFVVYDFKNLLQPVEFTTRPFVGLRDFHSLQKSHVNMLCEQNAQGLLVRYDSPDSCRLYINCPAAEYEHTPAWWYNFKYRMEKERGLNHIEDLWTPGLFKCRLEKPDRIVLIAQLTTSNQKPSQAFESKRLCSNAFAKTLKQLKNHQNNLIEQTEKIIISDFIDSNDEQRQPLEYIEQLSLAADQFIVQCKSAIGGTTILAGYPWFADWGRDAFISIPGLLLSTGRFKEAKSVLCTFAQHADDGMIPSRFDDYTGNASFNSVDASLWFINACFEYLKASDDVKGFIRDMFPTITWIIDSYSKGTKFDIRADDDALITAGNNQTQLTWMDARYDGVSFTPRAGKAVEVNALWYNSICQVSKFCIREDIPNARTYTSMARMIKNSFHKLFWNESKGYLNDCICLDGSIDESLRPNQIFAVSLEYSPLISERQKFVVDTVRKHLLTPFGLRTLNQESANYKGIYTGTQRQRDQAYHQGTVWPFLLGAFVESYLKVNKFSRKSRLICADMLKPLLNHLTQDACLGSISEIFDGDKPHQPRGCFAQAWSVAEIFRAYLLINS